MVHFFVRKLFRQLAEKAFACDYSGKGREEDIPAVSIELKSG